MSYSTQFNQAVERTLVAEGILSDRPSDRGGVTKYGVTIPFLSDYLGRPATKADILALTRETAIDAYHKNIWLQKRVGEIRDEKFQAQVFDFAVHSGKAINIVQKVVGAKIDGNLGPDTLALIASYIRTHGSREAANELVIERGRYLMDLTQHDPEHSLPSLEGWYNRVIERLDFGY